MSSYKPGEYVKVEVKDETTKENEWMWMLVDSSDDDQRLVFGKLDNEPIVHRNMRLRMELVASYDNIRDHRTADSFRQ
jgi:uncharacterized protein YegJ (DUF2314 family)